MEPVSPICPINIPPEVLGDRVLVPQDTPYAPNTIRAGGWLLLRFDLTTGELVWRQIFEGYGRAGLS